MSRLITYILSFATLSLFLGVDLQVAEIVLRPFDALLVLALLLWFYRMLRLGQTGIKKRDLASPITICMAFLSLYVPLDALWLSSFGTAVKEGIQYVEFLLYLLMVGTVTRRGTNRQLFMTVLFYGLSVIAVLTAGYHMSQGHFAGYKELGDTRYAFGVVALFTLCLYITQGRKGSTRQLLWLGAALALMLLSGERKGWVAFGGSATAALLVVLADSFRNRSRFTSLVLKSAPFVLVLFACGFLIYQSSFEVRSYVTRQLSSFEDITNFIRTSGRSYMAAESSSNRARLFLLDYSIDVFWENPVFGIGPDQFMSYVQWEAPNENFILSPHNQYLTYATETGAVGLAAFVGVWFFVIRRSYYAVRFAREGRGAPYVLALLVFGLAVYGAVLNLFVSGGAVTIAFLIFPAGLALSLDTA